MTVIWNILFVDDEKRILDGLRRMLRGMRHEWNMTFAGSAQQALEILQLQPMDVIVSDIRMPGMDGAELLQHVKNEYPNMVRIALSGQTSKQTILRCVGPIHQYLPKPCDAELLKNTIVRVCNLRHLLTNQKLQGLITQLETLPCMSSSYAQLMDELKSDDADIDRVAGIISQDVAMAAKMMHMVNSSFFGVRHPVVDIPQAITMLGLETVRVLALSARIFSQIESENCRRFNMPRLWDHSLHAAKICRQIAQLEGWDVQTRNYCSISGMLHDVGKVVLASKMSQEYAEILDQSERAGRPSHEVEQEYFGVTHAEVGAYLLGLWGFAHDILTAVTFHHRPQKASPCTQEILAALHAADIFAREVQGDTTPFALDEAFLQEHGWQDRWQGWHDAAHNSVPATA